MENFFRFEENGLDILLTTKQNGNMLYQIGDSGEVFENYKLFSKASGISLDNVVRVVLKNASDFIKVDTSHGGEGAYPDKQNLKGFDGIITTQKNLYIGITTADCFPVVIYDTKNRILGLAHCGWRGIVEKLEVKILNEMIKMGSSIEDIEITYSAGICSDCYIQHDDYLRDIFIKQYGYPTDVISQRGEHYSVDIKKASHYNLRDAGYTKDFHDLNICNYCDERLFSVRREGRDTGRILNLVAMI